MRKVSRKNYLKGSNDKIIKLIKLGKPFIVSRMGLGEETTVSLNYVVNNKLSAGTALENNAGIYCRNIEDLKLFAVLYNECLKNSDLLACFSTEIVSQQSWILNNYKLNWIYSRTLEPFYCINDKLSPWTLELKDKKVLIVNPFINSFQLQLKNKFQFFKKITDDESLRLFDEDQEFIFYKSFNTSAGNRLHSSWVETFEIMKREISELDFDIALLGCGGYGLPLCNFIKMELNKSAIYIGGGLQLLFGIKGKRWIENVFVNNLINKNGDFIYPSGDEIITNKERVEGGCYW